ncbi:MAG: YceI family protein [Bergeyella sp.]
MKIIKTILSTATIVGFLVFSQFATAQALSQKSSKITVDGTSSLHDWTMIAGASTFSATVSGNSISNVKFTMPVKNLKSTKGKMMDNKAYNALKADKAPNITFTASAINVGKSNVTGKLTIAGVTKEVSFPVTVVKNGTSYMIEGAESIKMSDFGVEKPGFMGVKTGDAVTVKVIVVAQ